MPTGRQPIQDRPLQRGVPRQRVPLDRGPAAEGEEEHVVVGILPFPLQGPAPLELRHVRRLRQRGGQLGIEQPAAAVEGFDRIVGEVLAEEATRPVEGGVHVGGGQWSGARDVGGVDPVTHDRVALHVELQSTQPVEAPRPGDPQPVVGVDAEAAVGDPVHRDLLTQVGQRTPGVCAADRARRVVGPDLVRTDDQRQHLQHARPVRRVGPLRSPGPGQRAVPGITDPADRRQQPLRHLLDGGDLLAPSAHGCRRGQRFGLVVVGEAEQRQPLGEVLGEQSFAYVEHVAHSRVQDSTHERDPARAAQPPDSVLRRVQDVHRRGMGAVPDRSPSATPGL